MLFNIRMIHLGISTSTSPTMSPPPDAVESKLPAGDCCFVSALEGGWTEEPRNAFAAVPGKGQSRSSRKGTAIALSSALMILPEDESRRVGAVVATAASWIRTVKRHINVLIFGFSNSRHSDIWTMGWLSSLSMIGREWLKTYLGEYNHKLRIWECAGSHPLLAPQQATMMH